MFRRSCWIEAALWTLAWGWVAAPKVTASEATSAEPTESGPVIEVPDASQDPDPGLRFYSAAPGGETGLLRVMEAGSGPFGSMRLSLHGGFYTSDAFLNYLAVEDYSQSRVEGRLALSLTAWDYLETFISLRNSSNKNSLTRPGLLQIQGDLDLGVKGFYPLLPGLTLGLDVVLSLYNGIGDVAPLLDATSLRTAALITYDFRTRWPQVPLRVHANAGMVIENSEALSEDRHLTWVEQYAMRVNDYHRFFMGIGLDAPLAVAAPLAIVPFLEYSLQVPLGVTREELDLASMGTDTTLGDVLPMFLTPGLRLTYEQAVTLDLAVDIALGGQKAYMDGVPSTPPYTIWLGLSFAFDLFGRVDRGAHGPEPARISGRVISAADNGPIPGAIISFSESDSGPVATDELHGEYNSRHNVEGTISVFVSKAGYRSDDRQVAVHRGETIRLDFVLQPEAAKQEPAPLKTGRVTGRVFNAGDDQPIGHAIVSFDDHRLPATVSDKETGRYTTCEMEAGTVQLTASRSGFKPLGLIAEVQPGQATELNFAMQPEAPAVPLPQTGTISGVVRDEKDQPMVAEVVIQGPTETRLESNSGSGAFQAEVAPGEYLVKVSRDGYLSRAGKYQIQKNGKLMTEFKLTLKPRQVVVLLDKDHKKITVRKKIHFASGKAILHADSTAVLDGVVDILLSNPDIKKVRVEGHTDSAGSAEANLRLSQTRAEAVVNYLVQQGIPPELLTAQGYGEARPIAPNTTHRGRELNRRVEFHIVTP